MKQWHPIFAQLLRPVVAAYYDVQTTVPVGDAPREADFLLLRRTAQAAPPFRGLCAYLTPWNIMEYKGPSVSARLADIGSLIEVGLGNRTATASGSRAEQKQRRLGPEAVSFWYLANHLGRRFLVGAERKLGPLEQLDPGLWQLAGCWGVCYSG